MTTELNVRRYSALLALAQGAAPSWDPRLHPREASGRWAHVEISDGLLGSGFGATKGLPSDTQDLHTERVGGKWGYTPDRLALHDRIVEEALRGKAKGKEATFLMGSPGAGKSAVRDQGGVSDSDAVVIDVDEVRKQLPEYKPLQDEGDRRADELTQMEASDVTDRILAKALDDGYKITVDGLGTSARYFRRLDAALAKGYKAKIALVTTPTDVAIKRVDERYQATGRRTSYYLTRQVSRQLAQEFPQLMRDYGQHADIELWDNSGKRPRRIAYTTTEGRVRAIDHDAVRSFLAKRHEQHPTKAKASAL